MRLTLGQYIVDKNSEKLNIVQETALDLDRNHSEICKFEGATDRNYKGVYKYLRTLALNARRYQVNCRHALDGTCA